MEEQHSKIGKQDIVAFSLPCLRDVFIGPLDKTKDVERPNNKKRNRVSIQPILQPSPRSGLGILGYGHHPNLTSTTSTIQIARRRVVNRMKSPPCEIGRHRKDTQQTTHAIIGFVGGEKRSMAAVML